jgi:hypothetical protein
MRLPVCATKRAPRRRTSSRMADRIPMCPRHPSLSANSLLALCNMRTLYLRNVPDDVVERLERLAARDATSVGAVAVRELAEVSRRADNPALLGSLPDLGVDVASVLDSVDAGRAGR